VSNHRFPITVSASVLAALMLATTAMADTPTKGQGTIQIVMLDKFYRVDGLQFDRTADIMKYLEGKKPAQIFIDVCKITAEAQVKAFDREVQRTYSGPVQIRRLEKNALECSWNSSKPLPRST
jgi:hypothetical protein